MHHWNILGISDVKWFVINLVIVIRMDAIGGGDRARWTMPKMGIMEIYSVGPVKTF